MQFSRFAFIIIIIFLLAPFKNVSAESLHLEPADLQTSREFIAEDGSFKLTIPAGTYSQPIDVYLFKLDSVKLKDNINPLTDIYYYYLYSSEVTDQSEFTLTLNYVGDGHEEGKTVYYLNPKTNQWELASSRAFLNNLTFKLRGKKNQLVVAGTHLQASALELERTKVTETYQFNANLDSSQLPYVKVCRPYLTDYFKSDKANGEEEVKKLQFFLREHEGFTDLPSTGYYGNQTYAVVRKFQEKYAEDILKPWGLVSGTGWVLKTTLDKINEIYCDNNPDSWSYEFSLSYQEGSKQAKNAYWQNGAVWEKLESFDDSRTRQVTAAIGRNSAQVALFEEKDQWVGEASWYAWQNGLFAASRDFPKGTRLKVTNQVSGENRGKFVVVEVNDYGPELGTGRIIDLDKVAFEQIAELRTGVVRVRIEVVN